MSTTIAILTESQEALNTPNPIVVAPADQSIVSPTSAPVDVDDEVAHMRRRLFRTLDHPDRSLVAIDCGSVPVEEIQEQVNQFFAEGELRETTNLVLAIPTDDAFAGSPTAEYVSEIKQQAFENHLDGKVSWLLIHQQDTELAALAELVQRQGGQWLANKPLR